MLFLFTLGLVVSTAVQQEVIVNRCDALRTASIYTQCTSCAASPASQCPRGFKKNTVGMGNADCRYAVEIAGRLVSLSGCRHVCTKEVTDHRCCPNFWGPLCLPCPSWNSRPCNWHGTCMHGNTGNGTCVCDEGFSGFACHECKNKNSYGEDCKSKCSCVNGECNSGPSGNGECLCQPPYSGPKCDQVTASCSNCPAYSYCKKEGDQASCECLPGFTKVGGICTGVCSESTCDANAECEYLGARNFQCICKKGFEGDGKVCYPVNLCSTNNGGCPTDSTICVYTGPAKSVCKCREGMASSSPTLGCSLKSACTDSSCDRTAGCETDMDGQPRCTCEAQQIGDGRRCYGNIIERVLELNGDGNHKGKLSGSVSLFATGCRLTLSKHGPFTVLLPLRQLPMSGISERFLCKHHLILGQHLYSDLQNNDFWTLGGEAIRFKGNKHLIFMKDPDTLYSVIQSDIAAANGIIHIIDQPFTNIVSARSGNEQHISKTIGEIVAKDPKYNRFLSLVDNCGTPMPLRGPGPLTVFIPTNDAIDRFRDGSLMYMLTDAKHKLQELLRHHMFSSAMITVDQIASMSEIQTMANQVVRVNITSDTPMSFEYFREGKVLLGEKGILLETTDIFASNGIIHTIDGVLVPPSILPILPHRCDVNESKITVGPCVRCSYLYETVCPSGSIELDTHLRDCEYQASQLSAVMSSKGCAKYCNVTRPRAECCKGFYGPDCKPCIGGFQHPCYDNGICFDGIHGNGTCSCKPGFEGIACHICSDPNKHGENCDEECHCLHGVCDNRPGSLGVCREGSCPDGYSGVYCDKIFTPCNSDGVFQDCHVYAYCTNNGNHPMCVCMTGYEGDGHSCIPTNPCLRVNRGGCHSNALCVYAGPANVSCVCNEGWTGDGLVCIEINNCLLEDRGGCDGNATCTFIGPGQHECICKTGFMGDGKRCEMINTCLPDNAGCHMMAKCTVLQDGGHVCTCPEGYGGDGTICYGTLMEELDSRWEYYLFNKIIQSIPLHFDGNVTALVPQTSAIRALKSSGKDFWLNPYVVPHLIKAHILDGIFTSEDLRQLFNKDVATLNPGTKWEVKNKSGEIMIHSATIQNPDVRVLNGYIHVIDKVLKPPLSDIPPLPPTLMEFLNHTSSFSLFRQAAVAYNLTGSIAGIDYTILMPTDEAIKEHLQRTNSTQLEEDLFKYHIITDGTVFPEHFDHGMSKNTLLGSSNQILFHFNHENQTLANQLLLSGNFSRTFRGVVIPVPHVLELHKNRCNQQVILKAAGYCTGCDSKPRCNYINKPVQSEFPANMKSNCKYRKRVGTRRRTLPGCVIDCYRYSEDHSCCPGYFGHSCFKCPGTIGNWCSNNGKCQDGILGNGECLCNEGFHGTACEDCEPGKYGKDCKSVCNCIHGKCLDGIEGNGKCLCYKGWRGQTCSDEIVMDACGGVCDINANCLTGAQGTAPTCSCIAGYQGNGTVCKEINPCDNDNGHCSMNANCTKTNPGERICTCREGFSGDGVVCGEIDGCAENNGGCHINAECIRTGPNTVACNCKPGYSGNGYSCVPVNPCRKQNGGCSWNARCEYLGAGKRNCTCRYNYIGDGITCRGTVKSEILRMADASWFHRTLMRSKITLLTKGPVTVFVPQSNYSSTFQVDSWNNKSRITDLLRYHLVGCEQLLVSDLQSIGKVVALSGHELRFTVRGGSLYINDEAKIIMSDYTASNGVIHVIDKVLIPYDLKNKSFVPPTLNVTSAAEAYGYTTFSKLLESSKLTSMLENAYHHPFTMFWPTDKVFSSLPAERKRWLFSEDHQDKLAAYLKTHIIRDTELLAINLPNQNSVRTMYGSAYSFSCDKNKIGDILVDDGNARLIERHLLFDVGIAYGIDQLLEPPSIGARCDEFEEVKSRGRCGSCFAPPPCSFGFKSTDESSSCQLRRSSMISPYSRRFGYYSPSYRTFGQYRGRRTGCQRTCIKVAWAPRCCKNHFGKDCQVCPGGLEAVCSNHGNCLDGMEGKGTCSCYPGFKGVACELCATNHYGSNCTRCECSQNGYCYDGIEGDGSCTCRKGWTGKLCESKLEVKPICTPECHPNAVCQPDNFCVCESIYEGDGRNCTAPDLCSEDNGGCSQHADCSQSGINVTCTCLSDYTGDGYSCSPIDRCVEEPNGGCSDFATCYFTGPNQIECKCLPGYVGNGIQCLEKVIPPVDRCLEDNGGCDPKADCKDLHFHEKRAGVFHLRSQKGKYMLNYTEAVAACQAEEATLATFSQLSDAQQLGMHMCLAGWMDGKQVGYPTTYPSVKCGDNHVGIVQYKNPVDPSSKYDAYCHSVKEVSCECGPNYVGNGDFCNGNIVTVVATNSNFSVFYGALLNYANLTKDGETLMNDLLKRSTFVTLFVPENTGFYGNESLSWRDVEYHISSNNSIHLYNDLKHGAVIPSRLGYNLTVTISPADTPLSDDTQLDKLVNRKKIIDWDIPATNGIIHIIKGPLKAPPAPVLPVSSSLQAQSGSAAVTAVLVMFLLIAVVAGLGYYFLKQRSNPFRFQYFKNDDDDGTSGRTEGNSSLVSIPNPLYTGYSAFAEPFGDSSEAESPDTPQILD